MGEHRAQRRSVLLGGAGVDGGLDIEGSPLTVWREAISVARVEPTGVGVGFLEQPGPLLEASLGLGIDEVIIRVEWARVMPHRGEISEVALESYEAICGAIRARGARVGLVLSDGTAPQWAGPDAWLLPSTASHFGAYAEAVMDRLGHLVDLVVTFEEPAAWAMAAWVLGAAPPFRRLAVADAVAALDAMGAAHVRALSSFDHVDPVIEAAVIESSGAMASLERSVFGGDPPVNRSDAWVMHRYGTGQSNRYRSAADHLTMPTFIRSIGRTVKPAVRPLRRSPSRERDRPAPRSTTRTKDVGTSIRCSSIVALVDERGRRRVLDGPARLRELDALVDHRSSENLPNSHCSRLIVGEVVDRWRWGTFRSREGIFGVDRHRGARGFEVREIDSAGADAAQHLRTLLEN